MPIPPLIERELRVALRKRRPVQKRLSVAAACTGAALLITLLVSGPGSGSHGAGRELHRILCLIAAYIILRTPLLTAGAFAEERRNQTIGLLFLSGLTAGEIFVSKLLSTAMITFTGLLAMFPFLALPFLIGGVSFELFLATVFAIPNLLLFALAVTLLASILTEDEGTAVILAGVLAASLSVVPLLIHQGQAHFGSGSAPSAWWLRLSPSYGPFLVWTGASKTSIPEFWKNSLVTLGWSILCLVAADAAVIRLWRRWRENREFSGWGARWQLMMHGTTVGRQRLAERWMSENPYVWLAARDKAPAMLAWFVAGSVGVVWVLCLLCWRSRWLNVPNLFITATVLNLLLYWITRYTAAQAIGNPRQDGSYEMLLTTPLDPGEIVPGQFEALRWHFGKITRVVLGINLALMLTGLFTRNWTTSALFVYMATWACLLSWATAQARNWRSVLLVMWVSLNCGRPAHAVWRVAGLNMWAWIWILYNLGYMFSRASSFPSGSPSEIFFTAMAAFTVLVIIWAQVADAGKHGQRRERRLVLEFREIVREPLPDPEDPRFKKWEFRERFPWGWALVQQQLHERTSRRQRENAG